MKIKKISKILGLASISFTSTVPVLPLVNNSFNNIKTIVTEGDDNIEVKTLVVKDWVVDDINNPSIIYPFIALEGDNEPIMQKNLITFGVGSGSGQVTDHNNLEVQSISFGTRISPYNSIEIAFNNIYSHEGELSKSLFIGEFGDGTKSIFDKATSSDEYNNLIHGIVISLPATATRIDDFAFKGTTKLTRVLFNDNINTIGVSAFEGCTQLGISNGEEVAVNMPVELMHISERAFFGCEKLKYVNLNDDLMSIESLAFAETNISEMIIPRSVTYLGDNIFKGLKSESFTLTLNWQLFDEYPMIYSITRPEDGPQEIDIKDKLGLYKQFSTSGSVEWVLNAPTEIIVSPSAWADYETKYMDSSIDSSSDEYIIQTRGWTVYGNLMKTNKNYIDAILPVWSIMLISIVSLLVLAGIVVLVAAPFYNKYGKLKKNPNVYEDYDKE